jgi:hypothetical protein
MVKEEPGQLLQAKCLVEVAWQFSIPNKQVNNHHPNHKMPECPGSRAVTSFLIRRRLMRHGRNLRSPQQRDMLFMNSREGRAVLGKKTSTPPPNGPRVCFCLCLRQSWASGVVQAIRAPA